VTIINLTSVNSKDKSKQSTNNSLYRLSPLLELKIVYSKINSKQIYKQMLYTIKASKDKSIS
jgi:hypothetical protein